jgi:hypothetical protein
LHCPTFPLRLAQRRTRATIPRWDRRYFPNCSWNFGKSDNRHTQIHFAGLDQGIEASN